MTEVFSDGFETGNFNAWTGTASSSGMTIYVNTNHPHHGTYSCETVLAAGTGYRIAYKNLGSYSTLYARIYVYWVSLPSVSGDNVAALGLTSDNDWYNHFINKVSANSDGTNSYWRMDYKSGGSSAHKTGVVALQTGVWYCIELKTVVSATIGEARLYVDGTEKLTATGLTNDGLGNIGYNYIGAMGSGYGGNKDVYVDCVVVADAYIGTEAEAEGQPYVSRVQQISGMQTFNPIHALKVKPRKLI